MCYNSKALYLLKLINCKGIREWFETEQLVSEKDTV